MNEQTNVNVGYVSPLKKICMTIGELPSSYLETMTYYEMLVWFTKYLKETLIPTINNNAEAVSELQTLYEELRVYVNNYFDNLDVQDEVNNKLDEMLEEGSLEQIIEQYLNSTALWCFNSISDMQEATNLIAGSYAKIIGYYNVNDGVDKNYYISDTAVGNDYIELNDNLYAIPVLHKSTRKLQQPMYGYLWLEDIPASDQKINIRNYKVNGFNGFIFCLHLDYADNEFTLRENLDTIKELCEYTIEQNMEVNAIKFHFVPASSVDSTILTKYGNAVSSIMSELSSYCENVYIFNEATYLTGNETKALEIIASLKSNYNVGIPFSTVSLRTTASSILSVLDFVGFNYYPNLSSQGKYSDKNLMQYKCNNNEDLNMIYYLISIFGKDKVNITETGIRDYYVYLREPSNFSQTQTEENNGEVVKLYYSIVLETLNNNVNSIATWFKTLYDSTFDFWTEWTGGMK